jgi:hypothetical protein
MKQVLKYAIPTTPFEVLLHPGSRFLYVDLQGKDPQMWWEVPKADPTHQSPRKFTVYGTGWDIPPNRRYLGTWQEDTFVWHLYEETSPCG